MTEVKGMTLWRWAVLVFSVLGVLSLVSQVSSSQRTPDDEWKGVPYK